jgi:tetratricopeptide (TPR) repeat protein
MHPLHALLPTAAILAGVAAPAARAEAVETGQVLAEATLRTVDGRAAPLLERGAGATALVFFKAPHGRSEEALRLMAGCQGRLAGRPVRWVGVVPSDSVAAEVQAAVASSGVRLTVLVDEGDRLYAGLGMRMHPAVAVVDRTRRLVAFEPYHPVDYCGVVAARVRRALGEISDEEVSRALAPAPSQLPGQDPAGVARRHVSFGRKLLEAKAYAQAHENARKALEIAPVAAAWALEGEIFAAEGRCEDAARAFAAARKVDPRGAAAPAGAAPCGR